MDKTITNLNKREGESEGGGFGGRCGSGGATTIGRCLWGTTQIIIALLSGKHVTISH